MGGAVSDGGESLFVECGASAIQRQMLVKRGEYQPGYGFVAGTDCCELFVNFSSKQKMTACKKRREQERKKDNDADEDKNRARSTTHAFGGSWNWWRHESDFA